MYYNHYRLGYREKWIRSSLIFGSAIDQALNELLGSKDLDKAKQVFEKNWNFSFINKKYTSLKGNPDILFSSKDLDTDLHPLSPEEEAWIAEFEEHKAAKPWAEIDTEKRVKYNSFMWDSLKAKALIILRDYHAKILPQFIAVTGIQHQSTLTNPAGDSVVQYLDFIATLQDGSVVLMDNKTTSSMHYYTDDSPGTSPQLLSYYYVNKEAFGLSAVGYVVILKNILKNKTKVCAACGLDGTESRAKTCDKEVVKLVTKRGKEVEGKERCGGEWSVTIHPEAAIKIIVNPVQEKAQDLVLSALDEANNGIKSEVWYKNLSICKNIYGSPCKFYNLCWKGDDSDLVKQEESV